MKNDKKRGTRIKVNKLWKWQDQRRKSRGRLHGRRDIWNFIGWWKRKLSRGCWHNARPIDRIRKRAIKDTKKGTALWPSGLTNDMLKRTVEAGIWEMPNVCCTNIERGKKSRLVDEQLYHFFVQRQWRCLVWKYKDLRPSEHGAKIWERVIHRRQKSYISTDNCIYGATAWRASPRSHIHDKVLASHFHLLWGLWGGTKRGD